MSIVKDPNEQHKYIIQIQKILSTVQEPTELIKKKNFCDAVLNYYSLGHEHYIADAQKATGLSYDSDGFCPPK